MEALDPGRRQLLKAYCHLDDELAPAEELLLERFYLEAVGYMEDAGVAQPQSGTTRRARYDTCVDAIVLESWDHRGTSAQGPVIPENPAFRQMLGQLKLTEPPVSESDTRA